MPIHHGNLTASGNPISRKVATSASLTAGVVAAGAVETGAGEAVGTGAGEDAWTEDGATVDATGVAVFFGFKEVNENK